MTPSACHLYVLFVKHFWSGFFFLPWFHEHTTKMDLSMKIDIQHLLKVVLKMMLERKKIKNLKNTQQTWRISTPKNVFH